MIYGLVAEPWKSYTGMRVSIEPTMLIIFGLVDHSFNYFPIPNLHLLIQS